MDIRKGKQVDGSNPVSINKPSFFILAPMRGIVKTLKKQCKAIGGFCQVFQKTGVSFLTEGVSRP
jgi:hypothetical protein